MEEDDVSTDLILINLQEKICGLSNFLNKNLLSDTKFAPKYCDMTPERRNSGARDPAVHGERICKHIHCYEMAHSSHVVATREELLEVVFSVWSLPRLSKGVSFASAPSQESAVSE
jgi:hypothetical protein